MSDSLVWQITKKNTCARVTHHGVTFSREKFNLMNLNCEKYSGYANSKAVDVSIGKDNKVELATKVSKRSSLPAKSAHRVPLNKGARAGAHTVASNTCDQFYRADLRKAALARWSRLNRLAKVQKGM